MGFCASYLPYNPHVVGAETLALDGRPPLLEVDVLLRGVGRGSATRSCRHPLDLDAQQRLSVGGVGHPALVASLVAPQLVFAVAVVVTLQLSLAVPPPATASKAGSMATFSANPRAQRKVETKGKSSQVSSSPRHVLPTNLKLGNHGKQAGPALAAELELEPEGVSGEIRLMSMDTRLGLHSSSSQLRWSSQ
jgi:hypothetical protein